ncbi:MFS general substrate transporter [Cryphonectria parasitica EP155]|uniref:MFS general substrate transporter n=1 Tax=Cryphonectria parasitica (strain ATCC 38755 / EP155) TaxID=660469 RepID=A0A9P5CN05_CRYP1|nr:MFS general substrate transporter [Cryphonectria parasitica EP155]KAF3764944.1 MFS general substrate transporter [Cryphonectria parasitica EP155]
MSLNRVSSLETFSHLHSPGSSRAPSPSSRDRRLSFNPLPESWDPHAGKPGYIESVGAFEVPRWKRLLQVSATVVYCLFAAGVVFGYAALKPVLKAEGAYQDVCGGQSGEQEADGAISFTTAAAAADVDTCVEIHLNLMFTVAAVSTNVAALPVGTILDHLGPRVCSLLGAFFLAVGSLLMAYERALPFDGLLFGYLFLALGGPFTYISSFQLSNAFPRHSGLILAILTGAFDASSALFLVYRVIFEKTAGAFGHDRFFLAYLVVPVVIVLLQLFLLPAQSYKTIGEMIEEVDQPLLPHERNDQVDEHTALLEEERREHRECVQADLEDLLGPARADRQARSEERKNETSGVWGVKHQNTAWEQIRSPWFIFICLFTVIQMTRINYFVATIRPQYQALLHSRDRAIEINNFFDLALPVGGILSIPFIGLLLDHTSTVAVLFWLVTVTTTVGVLGVIPEVWAAYANICLFVLYRPFYYTAVSDYTAKVFGFKTFGTVYGTIICLSGLFNFSQSGLDYLFHQTFQGDPVPVNVILLSAGFVVGLAMVVYVGYKARGLKRDMLELEAERAVGLHD